MIMAKMMYLAGVMSVMIYISITNQHGYFFRVYTVQVHTPIEVAALRDGARHNGGTGRGEGALSWRE